MTSARAIKRKAKLALGRLLICVSMSISNGNVSVHLPNRRKSIDLTRKEAELMQAVLATAHPQTTQKETDFCMVLPPPIFSIPQVLAHLPCKSITT